MKRQSRVAGAVLLMVSAGGISTAVNTAINTDGLADAAGSAAYEATVVRDGNGVSHITAADWGSLGFGQGYAISHDRACTILDQIVKIRGDRARWFGPGDDDEYINSDFAYRHLRLWEDAPTRWAHQPQRVQEVMDGYVAGFNAQIADNGAAGWCADEPWVGPITTQDMYAYVADVLLLASSRNLMQEIGGAQPPEAAAEASADSAPAATGARSGPGESLTGSRPSFEGSALVAPAPGASNGWALGAERSTTGGGLLLANPHFPWEGELRFWESHLTIPGQLNVYGVGLTGLPGIQIGFNDAVAWTHTVSAGHRFTLYRYDLDPTDPTVYLVDGQPHPMTPHEMTIRVANGDGTTREVARTLYSTHHGPVVDVDPLGWTTEQAVAIRDGNLEIANVLEQYLGMDAAGSMDEFQAVHERLQGVPWVNTIATSADGRAWIADTSATPNLSDVALSAWEAEVASGGLIGLVYNEAGIVMLDGSDSLFDWVDEPGAPAPGLIPYRDVPQLERSDYVFNANDGYWLANPDELLTGLSPLTGLTDVPQSARTRTNVMLLGETEEAWSIDDVEAAIFSDRTILSEALLPALVDACTTTPSVTLNGVDVDLTEACAALAGWDGTYTADARGAIVFREWLSRFSEADRTDAGRLFADGFDATDPAGSPSVPVNDTSDWLVQLGSVVQLLGLLDIPVDAPLGEWQWEIRSGDRIPIHGGSDLDGTANVVTCCAEVETLGPVPNAGHLLNDVSPVRDVPGQGFGYPVSYGASFVMAVQFGPDGPMAEGILTYGNPDDPAEPAYRAGLGAYSAGQWRTLLFDPDVVASLSAVEISWLTAPRG